MKFITTFCFCFSVCTYLHAQVFDVDIMMQNGSIASRINFVVLGDGYQAHESNQFADDVQDFTNSFFSETPFVEYVDYFNVFSIFTPSNESGAAMDPANLIDNYYGSTFWYAGIERLLVPTNTSNAVNVLANNFPAYDQVVMLVNASKYGGSGGWIATASTHSSSGEIAIHEIGHSFANLADEYWAGDQFAAERPNMTMETDSSLVKWKNWYGEYGVGIYQHCCGGNASQWYKPHTDCKMEFLGKPFCAVCTETFIKRIHTLTNMVYGFSPTSAYVSTSQFPVDFSLELIKPEPNSLFTHWQLNNQTYSINSESVSIDKGELLSGVNQLAVFVQDTTQLLRLDSQVVVHLHSVHWEIEVIPTGIYPVSSSEKRYQLSLYPVPAGDVMTVKFEKGFHANSEIVLYNLSGQVLKRVMPGETTGEKIGIDLADMPASTFVFVLYENGYPLVSRKIVRQ